jgi:hypothetical protein
LHLGIELVGRVARPAAELLNDSRLGVARGEPGEPDGVPDAVLPLRRVGGHPADDDRGLDPVVERHEWSSSAFG